MGENLFSCFLLPLPADAVVARIVFAFADGSTTTCVAELFR